MACGETDGMRGDRWHAGRRMARGETDGTWGDRWHAGGQMALRETDGTQGDGWHAGRRMACGETDGTWGDRWYVSWFVPRSSMSLRSQASTSDAPAHLRRVRINLQPNWVIGLLLIISYGLSYVPIILLYLILSILHVYISIPDLCP